MRGNLSKGKAPRGERGEPGNDGYSPKVTVEPTESGHEVTIQDKYGLHTFDVENGKDGASGDWNQNDESQPDYVKNRTHYVTYLNLDSNNLDLEPKHRIRVESEKLVRYKVPATNSSWTQAGIVPDNEYTVVIGGQTWNDEFKAVAYKGRYGQKKANCIKFELEQTSNGYIKSFNIWETEDFSVVDIALNENAEVSLLEPMIEVLFEGDVIIWEVVPLKRRYIQELGAENFSEDFLDTIATKEYVNENSGSISGDVTLDTSEIYYSDNGFEATFNTPLEKGVQLYYDYTANGKTVSGMAKPIKINDDGNLEVSIGDKYHTDFALKGVADVGSNTMAFTFIENVDYTVDVKELSIPSPIPFKFLGLSEGLNLGFNSEVTPESLNSNNFGSSNYIDGEHSNTFGTGNTVKGKVSTAIGQNANITGNLDFLGGDRGNITGRCDFGYGTDVFMSGQNSGAIGYGLRSVGDNQFVLGQYNEDDTEALLIVGSGSGDDENSRRNAFVVKKDGNVYINDAKLIKLTQADRDKLDSFNSNGSNNTNTGASSAQLGFMNVNSKENTIQLGCENNTESAAGGYIYQIGYGNKSFAGQSYLIGKKLVGEQYEQVVVGKFNSSSDGIFVVGNGNSESDRKNALVVDRYNNAYFNGEVYAKNKKVLTEDSAEVASLKSRIQELENERLALDDAIRFMYSDINSLNERLTSLENK